MNINEIQNYLYRLGEKYFLVRLELFGDGSGFIAHGSTVLFEFSKVEELEIAAGCGDFL